MMQNKSNIGIIMTVFNGDDYLKNTLDSLVSQSYCKWTLFILENASTDHTISVIDKYSDESRILIKYLPETLPRTEALNYCYNMLPIDIDYVMVLDADDTLEPKWLECAVDFLDINKDVGVLGGWAYIMDQNGDKYEELRAPIYPKLINELFSYTFPIVHSSLFFRKDLTDSVLGPYDTSIKIGQDWDLCIRLSQVTEICVIGEFSVSWRRYSSSITGNSDNFIRSRMDKLSSLINGSKCINSKYSYFRHRGRVGVENLAISLLYFKQGDYFNFLKNLLISIYINPFSILLNNKVLKKLSIRKPFHYKHIQRDRS